MLHLFMEPDKFLLMKTQPSEAAPHTQIALTQSSEFVELLGESWQYSFGNAISSRARVMCMGLAACVSSPPEGACSCNHKVSVESPVSGAWSLSVCLSVSVCVCPGVLLFKPWSRVCYGCCLSEPTCSAILSMP